MAKAIRSYPEGPQQTAAISRRLSPPDGSGPRWGLGTISAFLARQRNLKVPVEVANMKLLRAIRGEE